MFKIGNTYHGFKLIEERVIEEVASVGRLFNHEKSGARLLYLENDDNNKVFSVAFKTPPKNNTGVAHILEHSVLAGSRKFTTKEPFMDMAKSSLRTFINAMTSSDKTIYPVGSRNEKDFNNLMDVYLDAVFFPKIYEVPEIFYQEGWHHEIFNKEDEIIYKGVVYNEMKGAYSSPERILNQLVSNSLLKDTTYGFSSGGDPDYIPELSIEEFLDFHKKLYHPSNSYIYLYGDGDILKQLEFINENYLDHFNVIEVDSKINKQTPNDKHIVVEDYYNVGINEDINNKDFLSFNFFHGELKDLEESLMADIIAEVLIKSDASLLKNNLLKSGIGRDTMFLTLGGKEVVTGIAVRGANSEKKEEFIKIVNDTLNELVKNGIDKKLLLAAINSAEYTLREPRFPTKGILYKMMVLEGWIYNKNPMDYLKYNDIIVKLRSKIDTNYFEEYIKKNYVDNKHTSLVVLKPKPGLANLKELKIKEDLKKYKESLTDVELDNLIKLNHDLKAYQERDNTEEAKATIPKLALSDVEKEVEEIKQEVINKKDYTLIHNDIFTNKIAHIDLMFDISMIVLNDLPYANLLSLILGLADTKNRSYKDLSNEIYAKTGGIDFEVDVYSKDGKNDINPKLIVKGKAVSSDIKSLFNFYEEIIFDSVIVNKERLKEILYMYKSRLEIINANQGHIVSMTRLRSYYSKLGFVNEKIRGLDFYWFISEILNDFDNLSDKVIYKLNDLYKQIFNKNNLILSFTGDKEDLNIALNNINSLIDKLSREKYKKAIYEFKPNKLNEGIKTNYNVSYVSKGYNYFDLGYKYSGKLQVVSTILNGDYLHNKIRAQGGAYGVFILINRFGNLEVASYRDPNIKETIEAYNNIDLYLNNLNLTDVELTQYIIGTIARIEPAYTPSGQGSLQTRRYLEGITKEELEKVKNDVLNVTLEDIKEAKEMIKKVMNENCICVLGNENKINDNKELFANIVDLVK